MGPALRQGSYTRLVFGESQGLRSSALGISLAYGFPYRRLTLTGRPSLLCAARGIRTRNRPLLRRPRLPDCATAAWLRGQESNLGVPRPKRGHGRQRRNPDQRAGRRDRTGVFGLEDRREHQPHQAREVLRRPCRVRTGVLRLEGPARSPTTPTVHGAGAGRVTCPEASGRRRVSPRDRTGHLSGFDRALTPSEPSRHGRGRGRNRTDGLRIADAALYQLSYKPMSRVPGNRTPLNVLVPNQAASHQPRTRLPARTVAGRSSCHAIRCGILKIVPGATPH
jgi:hypothetical protein